MSCRVLESMYSKAKWFEPHWEIDGEERTYVICLFYLIGNIDLQSIADHAVLTAWGCILCCALSLRSLTIFESVGTMLSPLFVIRLLKIQSQFASCEDMPFFDK